MATLFTKIINGEIPGTFVHQTTNVSPSSMSRR